MKKIILYTSLLFSSLSFGQTITTVAGNGTWGYAGDGGPATAAELAELSNVAIDSLGDIYIADYSNQCIRKVNTSGIIATIAGLGGPGNSGYSGDGGQATAAKLMFPLAVNVDIHGNIYIAGGDNRIRKVNNSGIITTIVGNGFSGFTGDGGQATAAEINTADGIIVDPSGSIYIADGDNFRVRKVDTAGIITTIAGNGVIGFSGDGGPATAAEMGAPNGIVFDGSGNMYIADGGNRIRKVNKTGIISTIAGIGTSGYSGDGGPATAAELYIPTGVGIDIRGNVYIADFSNYRIREINSLGIISTIAGAGHALYSGDGGPATDAGFDPIGIAVDTTGDIYIADQENNRIRKVTPKLSLGINALEYNQEMEIYPNPTNGRFTIQTMVGNQSTVEVFNILGEKVYKETLRRARPNGSSGQAQGDHTIDLSTQLNGSYLVKVQGEDGNVFVKKVSIVR